MASPEFRASQKNQAESVKYSLPFCSRGGSFLSHLHRQKRFVQYQASEMDQYTILSFQLKVQLKIRIQYNQKLHSKMPIPPKEQHTPLMDDRHVI